MKLKKIGDAPRRGDHAKAVKRLDEITRRFMEYVRRVPPGWGMTNEEVLHYLNYRRRESGLKDMQRSGRQRSLRRAS